MRQRHSSAVPSSANTHRTQNLIATKSQPQEKEGPQFDPIASPKNVYALCLAFRMVNAVLVQTYFNPDEHWQALEVAHRITFGFGHLTWEWEKGIRSFLHPLLFALLYKLLALLGLDTPWFMVKAPRLFQSLFSAFGDLYLYKLSVIFFGDQVAKWALFSQLTNWFVFFCLTRTLSNSLETVLTIVSLYYWPCMRPSSNKLPLKSRKWGLIIAALACAIRPTSAIIWLYVGLLELFVTRDILRFIFHEVAPIGVLVLGLTFLIDRLMYGSWILVPLNFLRFNFLSSGGDYYGTHKWHWYFTQGFSVMVFSFLPFSIDGIMQSKQWKLSGLVAWVLGVYSVLGHKEFRFVLPVLPIALIFSGYSLAALKTSVSGNGQRKESSDYHTKCPAKMQLAIFFLLATNIPMALYMSLVHQMDSTPLTFTDLLNSETDLNEPPLPYDFPSSQYCSGDSNDCTNEETYCAPSNKKAQRQGNFTLEEDKLLVSAWLNVGLDPVKGSEQKKKHFWSRIATYFQENKKWTSERTDKSLTNRWSTISASVNKFCGYYSQIENFRKSGYTEQDKIVEAKQMYKKEEGSAFGLDHCWVILRFQQKWMDECQKLNAKKKGKTYQNGTPDSINLEDENEEGPEPAPLKRPIGRKAAKEVSKRAKSKEHVGDNENVPSTINSELEDFRAKKLESERLRAQQLELLIASEERQVALREKEIEIQERSEDVKIMAMDTSDMPPIRAEYIISLQKEILAKRAASDFN